MRWIVIGIVLLAAGAAAGWVASGITRTPETVASGETSESVEVVKLRAELKRLEDEKTALADQYAALESETSALRTERSLMESVLDETAAHADDAPIVETDSTPAAPPAPDGPGRDRRRQQPTPEQMAEYRKNFQKQQDTMRARLDEELAQMGDPNAAQNFNALLDYRKDEQQLRQQMRDAKTDDERKKIAADLQQTELAARQLLNEQQDSVLRSLAAASGIKNADAQQKFVNDTRQALANPFFAMSPMLMGGGRGGPRGPGGPGGFGGPPR